MTFLGIDKRMETFQLNDHSLPLFYKQTLQDPQPQVFCGFAGSEGNVVERSERYSSVVAKPEEPTGSKRRAWAVLVSYQTLSLNLSIPNARRARHEHEKLLINFTIDTYILLHHFLI